MIRKLQLRDVGPARKLDFEFAPRLNVLTGDNGLGKTFVLDVIWWVLTTTWAGEKAFPWCPPAFPELPEGSGYGVPEPRFGDQGYQTPDGDGGTLLPEIQAVLCRHVGDPGEDEEVETGGKWQWESQEWVKSPWHINRRTPGFKVKESQSNEANFRPPSLVIYARIDGSYAIWDSSYVKGGIEAFSDAAVVLRSHEVWDGKEALDPEVQGGKRTVIAGLIADWVNWQQRAKSPEFEALRKVLNTLATPDDPLIPAEPSRVHLRDRRDIPTLTTSYGQVPVTLASAGMKRALSLAYLLVWAWTEHLKASRRPQRPPTRDIVLLIDEPELHLHPGWQRVFLPSVLKAVSSLAPNAAIQVFSATHSPMVLASLESVFIEEIDDLFVMARDGRVIRAQELPFGKEGNVSNWLSSEVFKHVGGRSREAELAVDAAMDFMAGRMESAESNLQALYGRLRELPIAEASVSPGPDLLGGSTQKAYAARPLVDRVHDALKGTLPGHDEFWVHWTLVYRPGPRSVGR